MSLHKSKSRFFKSHPLSFKKLLVVFIVFVLFMLALRWLLHNTPTQLFTLKEHAVEDVDFSDIYYQTRKVDSTAKKQVLLVNISSWAPESIRYKLDTLIRGINIHNPKVLGVDIYFEPKTDAVAFKQVNQRLDTLFQDPKIVIGASYSSLSEFPIQNSTDSIKTVNFGCINIPGEAGKTFREYYYSNPVLYLPPLKEIPSLSVAMYQVYTGRKLSAKPGSTFMIRYSSGTERGFYHAHTRKDPQVLQDTIQDFPAIDADDFIALQHTDSIFFDSLIRDKCIIIGALGRADMDYESDLTDKHRVPLNLQLLNRMPTMPGAVVHANALQMLIDREEIKKITGWRYYLVAGLVLFGYLLVFNLLEKIRPFLLKLVIEILFLILSVLLLIRLGTTLMEWCYHLNVGPILICLAFLIEYKLFAFELYEYLEKQNLHKRISGWYATTKYYFKKDRLSKKVRVEKIEIDSETVKNEKDEA